MNHAPEAVTFAREKAGLTKRALAQTCGFSEQLLCDIEAGRRNATPEKLLRLATALNCPVVVLEAKRVTVAASTGGRAARGGVLPNSAPPPATYESAPGDIRAAS
ncbi:helix-turn-helix domain-containing protein [Streptomyces sp. NPDC051664]|uniref:helix-turn-helix domain-containing protein n=1 Tax=Streptomyces sp. NPDC051664 TaxID=3365668 RepID=UPI003789F453